MKKIYSTKKIVSFRGDCLFYVNREQLIHHLKLKTGFENIESWKFEDAGIFVHITVRGYRVLPERKWSKSFQIARRMKRLLND